MTGGKKVSSLLEPDARKKGGRKRGDPGSHFNLSLIAEGEEKKKGEKRRGSPDSGCSRLSLRRQCGEGHGEERGEKKEEKGRSHDRGFRNAVKVPSWAKERKNKKEKREKSRPSGRSLRRGKTGEEGGRRKKGKKVLVSINLSAVGVKGPAKDHSINEFHKEGEKKGGECLLALLLLHWRRNMEWGGREKRGGGRGLFMIGRPFFLSRH